jgi:HTH-type transcriptional regulator/antitoxin HigA
MQVLKYKVIKDKEQYYHYCDILEELITKDSPNNEDEIELLTVLIDKWDADQDTFSDSDPIEIIKTLMLENNLKSKDLADILELSKGTVSKILNYQKGLSKESIRKISKHFNISQEALNKPYQLESSKNELLQV